MQEQKRPESSFEKAHSDEVFGSLRVPEDLVSTRPCTKNKHVDPEPQASFNSGRPVGAA